MNIFAKELESKKMETKINGNDLLKLGYSEGDLIGIALKINNKRIGFTKNQITKIQKCIIKTRKIY